MLKRTVFALSVLLVATVFISNGAQAAGVAREWVATGSLGYRTSATDSAGNTYVTSGFTVAKYTSGGSLAWETTFSPCGGSCEAGYARGIAVSPDGSYVWTVGAAGFALNQDWFVAQLNSSGIFQWSRSLAGAGNQLDDAQDAVADSSNNVYVTGTTHSGSNPDMTVAKWDVSGNFQWQRSVNYGGNDYGNRIGLDASGRVYVGATFVVNAEDYGIAIYDSNGSQQCTDRYNGPGPSQSPNDTMGDLAVIPGGGAYITGGSNNSNNPSTFDVATVKWNTGCGQDWVRRYDTGSQEHGIVAGVDSSNGVYIGGTSDATGNYGVITLHYDSGGGQTGPALYQGPAGGNDRAGGIAVDSSGAYISGSSDFIGEGGGPDSAWVVIAYTPGLIQRWVDTYSAPTGPYIPVDVHLDASGLVYAAGNSNTGGHAVIKYCADTDNDLLSDCYEDTHSCLDSAVNDSGSDPDTDGLSSLSEFQGEDGQSGTGDESDPCNPETDGDGCGDGAERGPSEFTGGRRNPNNPYDYFNPTNDGVNRVDDILAVVQRYFSSGDPTGPLNTIPPSPPAYHPKFNRAPGGPNVWNLTQGNGQVLLADILAIIAQYFHDCGSGIVKVAP